MRKLFLLLTISLCTLTSFAGSNLTLIEEKVSEQNFHFSHETYEAFGACYGHYQRTVTNSDGTTYIETKTVYLGEASNYFECASMVLAHLQVLNYID